MFGYTTGRIGTQQEAGRIVTQWSVWVHNRAHWYTTGSGAHSYTMECLGTQPAHWYTTGSGAHSYTIDNGVFGYTTGRIGTQQEAGRIVTQWSVWVHNRAHWYTTGSGVHSYTMECLGTQPDALVHNRKRGA